MTASPKPVNKGNLLHQQILGELLANKPGRLAGNVSDLSIERAAKRWTA